MRMSAWCVCVCVCVCVYILTRSQTLSQLLQASLETLIELWGSSGPLHASIPDEEERERERERERRREGEREGEREGGREGERVKDSSHYHTFLLTCILV